LLSVFEPTEERGSGGGPKGSTNIIGVRGHPPSVTFGG